MLIIVSTIPSYCIFFLSFVQFYCTVNLSLRWATDDAIIVGFAGDKKLVQSLVLDALVTDGFDKRGAMHKEEYQR